MGKRKCTVCEEAFELVKAERKIVRDLSTSGLGNIFASKEDKWYDSFDCPHCGCQNIIQERKRNVAVAAFLNMGEEPHESEEVSFDEELDTTEDEIEQTDNSWIPDVEGEKELAECYADDSESVKKTKKPKEPSCFGKWNCQEKQVRCCYKKECEEANFINAARGK